MSYTIETIRHSTAHLLAAAVQELWPQVKLGVGPVIEHGFYYDFDLPTRLAEKNFQKIEKQMRAIIARKVAFTREEIPIDAAIGFFEKKNQPYKMELLRDLKTKGTTAVRPDETQDLNAEKPTETSVYHTGKFVDLCRGPHVADTSALGVFKLMRVAGAYWRGNEKNPQMQRVYGIAFATQKELDDHVTMLAEATRRDHRKLGVELDLFTFSDLVGPGLPLWTPRGTLLRNLLDNFIWELRRERGYVKVTVPHITKKELYETSGHWQKFKNDLFRITTRENHEFAMKPMNCPHHTQIYARTNQSYRDLPQRYAETTMVYRDEQSGELSGLSRVLCITQDDAHVFCRTSQVKDEFLKVWDIIDIFYRATGFGKLKVRLSLHDPKHPEKYLGTPEMWRNAENTIRELAKERGIEFSEALGEAAFYGPKIDFIAHDSLGRQWQVATIQLDINMPDRFDLTCVNEKGEKERIVMIHAAIMGSIERFVSVLIEHHAGAFPTWLAPVQVAIIPVSDDHMKAAEKLGAKLDLEGFRVSIDGARDTVGYKIRKAEKQRVPYMIVIGDKEKSLRKLAIRVRGEEEIKTMALSSFMKRLQKETKK